MKTQSILLVIGLILILPLTVCAQEQGMLRYVDKSSVTLTERQQELFEIIQSRPQTKAVYLVRVEQSRLDLEREDLQINLPEQVIDVHKQTSDRNNLSRPSWSGKINNTPQSTVLISVRGQDVTGHINTGEKLYSIRPLTGGLQVLVEIDPSKMAPEAPPLELSGESEGKKKSNENPSQNKTSMLSGDPIIQVLVAYTPAAKASTGNIRELINEAGNLANLSFGNSDVSASTHIVAMVEVDYVEDLSDSMSTDLNRLRLTSDGYMDEVHQLRNDFDADLVALIVDEQADVCGRGYQRSSSSTAFSVTKYDCIDIYTFAHELGHNLAAHHDQANGTNQHFQYGHGYNFFYQNQLQGTIMSYPGHPRNYWSNPDINYQGSGPAMGTAQYENNARVWDERAPTVAAFRTSSIPGTVVFENGYNVPDHGHITIASGTHVLLEDDLIVGDGAKLTIATNNITFDNNSGIIVEDGGELLLSGVEYEDLPVEVQTGGVLTLQPGVRLTFGTGQRLVVHGRLLVNGSPANRVEFTSSGSNSWEGIELSHGSSSETSELNWCEVRNASIGIRSNTHNSTPIITNCIIEDNEVGIRIAEFFKGGFPEMMVYGNTIQNNNTGLSVQYSSSLGMEGNEFHDNGNGVYLSNSSTVLIQHNLFDGHSTALSSYSSGSQVLRNKMLSNSNSGLSLGFSSVSTANENDIYPGNYAVSTFYSTVHAGATANYGANYWGMSPVHAMFHEGLGSQILDYFPPAPSPWNNWNQFQMAPESGSQEEVLVQVRTNSSPATAAAEQRQPMFESNCDDAGAAMTSQTNWPHNHEAQLMELAGCYMYNEKVGFPEFLASEVKSRVSETDRAYGSALNLESIFHIRDRQYEKAHDNYVRINELFSDEPGLHKLALASLVYLYFEHLENHGEAARYFGELQTRYPDSETTFQLAGIYGRQLEGGSREDREQAESGTPMANELQSNYPNPFNPTTHITYKLSEPAQVHLTVYDMLVDG